LIKQFYTYNNLPIINNISLLRTDTGIDNLNIELINPNINIHVENTFIKITQDNKEIIQKTINKNHIFIFFKILLYLLNNSFYTLIQINNIIEFINTYKTGYKSQQIDEKIHIMIENSDITDDATKDDIDDIISNITYNYLIIKYKTIND